MGAKAARRTLMKLTPGSIGWRGQGFAVDVPVDTSRDEDGSTRAVRLFGSTSSVCSVGKIINFPITEKVQKFGFLHTFVNKYYVVYEIAPVSKPSFFLTIQVYFNIGPLDQFFELHLLCKAYSGIISATARLNFRMEILSYF